MQLKDITKEAAIISNLATFGEAVQKMVKEQTNSLLVIDEEGTFVGEINVSDLFEAIVPGHLNGDEVLSYFNSEEKFVKAVREAADRPVEEFMALDAEPIRADDDIMAVAAMAIAHGHSRIPVVDHDSRPVGIISRRGLKQIIANFLGIKES